jgi:hypothetical protein
MDCGIPARLIAGCDRTFADGFQYVGMLAIDRNLRANCPFGIAPAGIPQCRIPRIAL